MSEPTPTRLKRDCDDLRIEWSDGVTTSVSWRTLRHQCPCAACGEKRSKPVDPFKVLSAQEIAAGAPAPLAMRPVGHYAYQIDWNDGHTSGIYPIGQLRKMSQTQESKKE